MNRFVVGRREGVDAGTSVVWHVFCFDRDPGRQWVIGAGQFDKMQIAAEGEIVAEVAFQAQPIVAINKVVIVPVHDIYVPSHQVHLEL